MGRVDREKFDYKLKSPNCNENEMKRAIRQLAYGMPADQTDEYLQIDETTSLNCLNKFYQCIIKLFGPQYLRRPNEIDIQRLIQMHKQRHGFPGMLGSLDLHAIGMEKLLEELGEVNILEMIMVIPLLCLKLASFSRLVDMACDFGGHGRVMISMCLTNHLYSTTS
ncbi:hypothetical protein DH2020_037556 [Rehmannia glutinosa]|uniref:Uncharacterized protein n=1 Tax=Rehmannia glutinosa TaxID=99300 RepID=A0ABR0V1D6_REHGL